MLKKLTVAFLALMLVFGAAGRLYAETDKKVELSADTIEYDSKQGVMTANGGVKFTRAGAVLTGQTAEYNTKTGEGLVTGGVKAVTDNASLTAEQIRSFNNNLFKASGNVVLVNGDSTLTTSSDLDYYADRQYAVTLGAAKLTMPDGIMTAARLEAFLAEDRAIASGNVHILSDRHELDATADQAVYYGAKTGQGKTVLTGNARAVQKGNVLTGNTLTIYLDDRAMEASGRTKLVVRPE